MPSPELFSVTGAQSLSTITVNYSGFTPAAQNAFQAAVDIWKTQVSTTVPIVIDAQFIDLGPGGLLGQTSPTQIWSDLTGFPRSGTWFPDALANKLHGSDIGGPASEIQAEFNSNPGLGWYYGTDGFTPSGQVDFETVALHELAHGLGFVGSADVSGGRGQVGSSGLPYIFDTFVSDGGGRSILNTSVYPNNSTALAGLLTSINNLFWNGPGGIAAAGGPRPQLYAPSTFQSGSTYSHLDENSYPPGDINSLMTPMISTAEAIHTPGPIVLGMFNDMGWGAQCSFGLDQNAVSVGSSAATVRVSLSAGAGCSWTATTSAPASFVSITGASTGIGSAIITIAVSANTSQNQRIATFSIGGQTLTITQAGTNIPGGNLPSLALDNTALKFVVTANGRAFTTSTGSQIVRLTQTGAGTVSWTATPNQPWLTVSPASGTGAATLTIDVTFAPGLSGLNNGVITLASTGAANTPGPIAVTLAVSQMLSAPPFGVIDTPADKAMGVTGSIALTGWALDDVGVTGVRVLRDPVGGEPSGAKIFIGDAVLVDGARPDVQAAYPGYPHNSRAGWGLLVLTNALPNQGNGTFTLYAYASDGDGQSSLLGARTITCTNSTATTPFGAIDTPAQGQTVSGTVNNFGWVLAPGTRRADVPGGGTVTVVIDGVAVGSPAGWTSRSDITALFPQFAGVQSAAAVYTLDTLALTDGLHTIAWSVRDDQGGTAGIGSRFFTVSNGSVPLGAQPNDIALSTPQLENEIDGATIDVSGISVRRGFDFDFPFRRLLPDAAGLTTVYAEEVDRIEIELGGTDGAEYAGYLRKSDGVAPLPAGSHLEANTGVFTWQPGVGFVGSYSFVFVRLSGGRPTARKEVRIDLYPKGSGRVGPQLVIDIPGSQQDVARPFVVAGWASDLDAETGTGIDAVHVWAYPLSGGLPIFLGAAAYGGRRPDVEAIYGDRFRDSGYFLTVEGLDPGIYELAVFGRSSTAGKFLPAKTVQVIVR